MTYFYLCRASGDDDTYALRFFRDLHARVKSLTGSTDAVGYVDAPGNAGGSEWSPAAREALTSCRTLVALCSPYLFASERCGREWWLFTERLRRQGDAAGNAHRALIPVVWSGAGGASDLDTEEPAIRQLIRLRSRRDEYQAYVDALAARIVEAGDADPVPPAPDLDPATAPNAFDPIDALVGVVPPAALAPGQRVHFVVAAGTRAEMRDLRNELRFYGDRPQDWSPYRPATPDALAAHARAVAAERLFDSDVSDLDDLSTRMSQARERNEILVLLVDAWITKLAAHQRALADLDADTDATVAVLAPANTNDLETVRHRAELHSNLAGTLANSISRRDQLVRIEINSIESFDVDLAAVLEEAQNRIFSHGRVFRRPADEDSGERPILQGP